VDSSVQHPESSVAADLQLLYSTSVTRDQIDQLGHMNVRFYGVHALSGARKLVADIGTPETSGATRIAFTDLYTRHYLEQLEGSPLEVWGGVLDVRDTNIRMYFELRNPARDEIAATFVFTVQHQHAETHAPTDFGEDVKNAATRAIVAWPKRGQPRSIDLEATPRVLSMAELKGLNLPGRATRLVEQKDCDSNGVYRVDSFQDLVWGNEDISEDNDWIRTLDSGEKMGWATMESRCTLIELPRVGARVQSFSAIVQVGRKAQHERFWVYDIDREVLLCTASFVDVAFNINTRRAIEVPEFERERLDKELHAELA